MIKKLFVGNLPYSAKQDSLEELFSQAGKVESCNIITDKFSGQSRGFAFVEMETEDGAKAAIEKFNNYEMDGRKLVVNESRPKEDSGRRDNKTGSFSRDRG